VRTVVDKATLENGVLRVLRVPLSVSLHQRSKLILF